LMWAGYWGRINRGGVQLERQILMGRAPVLDLPSQLTHLSKVSLLHLHGEVLPHCYKILEGY
jgi:hypothetical protein